jgi:hypothetical protein
MRPRRRFSTSESWSLEDRITLSHAGAAAEVAALATSGQVLPAMFRGSYLSTVQHGVDTVSSVAALNGSDTIPGIGPVSLAGSLSNNAVFPSHFSQTQGNITLTAARRTGTVTLALTGPYVNLAPPGVATVRLTFTVVNATGQFSSFKGAHGTAVLTLKPSGPPQVGLPTFRSTSHGTFSLVLARG